MEKTINELLREVSGEMCDKYCKIPDRVKEEMTDEPDSEYELFEKYCKYCPLDKLGV